MTVSIAAVMRRVRNFFERESIEGTFTITDGVLEPVPDAPYIAITGSSRYDGVWPSGDLPTDRPDETFSGKVWGLHPPDDFLAICSQIGEYAAKRPAGAPQSESFGDYSYSMGSAADGLSGSWENVFALSLFPYRRMYTEVNV